MYGANYVFHAAALKEVPSCEFFPMEAVRTNIIGTDNVITAAVEAGVQRVVFLSTDKAAYPINTMGMTKAVGEKVVQARAQKAFERGGTVLACTRYGNVMCSRGSVIPLFIDQIKRHAPITITDPNMTRFLMNLDEAVDLVAFAFEHAEPGDLFVQKADASTDYTRSPMGHAMQIPLMGGTIGRVERFKGGQSAPFRGILMRAGEDGWMEPTDWVLVGEVYAERIRTYWQNGHARNFYEHRLGSWGVTDERGLRVVMEEEPWYLQLESLVSPHTSFRSWDDLQTWERDRQGPAQLSQKVTYRFYRKR